MFGLAGFFTASAQWLLLRKRIKKAYWWIIVSTLATVLAVLATYTTPWSDYILAWNYYPLLTALPVSIAQGLFLFYSCLRIPQEGLLYGIGFFLIWVIVRSIILAFFIVEPYVIYMIYSGHPSLEHYLVLLPLIAGLPFGWLCGVCLGAILRFIQRNISTTTPSSAQL